MNNSVLCMVEANESLCVACGFYSGLNVKRRHEQSVSCIKKINLAKILDSSGYQTKDNSGLYFDLILIQLLSQ